MLANFYISGFFRLNDQLAFARVSDDVLGRPQVKFWVWGVSPWHDEANPRKLQVSDSTHWSLEPCLSLILDVNKGIELYAVVGSDYDQIESWSSTELSDIYAEWGYTGYEEIYEKYQSDPATILDILTFLLNPVIRLRQITDLNDLDPKSMQLMEHRKAAKAMHKSQTLSDDVKQLGFFEFFPHERNDFESFPLEHKKLQKKYCEGKMHLVSKFPYVYITYREGAFDVPEPVFVYRKRGKWFLHNLEGMEEISGPFSSRKSAKEAIISYQA
ncbi:hypothetical protein PQO03_18395 [Lentisphaera profundi]|uniref:Uncharacterized protein n=1 Tax=Lentisphaera profundi TaxID=1658616 RepID=A0ABY7VUD1_9BACT|nr:hypothetical protein [Lentisphaera profundi]WDE97800.1 hypothetical protein PQO03_18395 [Lentisphaera profundi]